MYYAPPCAGFCKAKLACLCILKKRGINPSNPISNPTRQTASKRQGLTRLPRKGAEGWPARCGGDFRSPRKPAGPAFRHPRSSPESPAAAHARANLRVCPSGKARANLRACPSPPHARAYLRVCPSKNPFAIGENTQVFP
jgi:hypothetical protein